MPRRKSAPAGTLTLVEMLEKGLESPRELVLPPSQEPDWEFEPAPLSAFLYDTAYLRLDIRLSPRQLAFLEAMDGILPPLPEGTPNILVPGHCPPPRVRYTEAAIMVGKGGGKDRLVAILMARIVYLLLCLKDPCSYFQQGRDSHIDLLNLAYNAKQAHTIFFKYFLNTIQDKRCFEHLGFEPRVAEISFPKRITCYSGHSDEEAQEGMNLFFAVLDEIAAFNTDAELEQRLQRSARKTADHSASALHKVVLSSVISRFPTTGKVVAISFPRYAGDYICELYDAAADQPWVYREKAATWEWNPTKTRADFNREFKRNPEEAAGKYACEPAEAIGGFFKDTERRTYLWSTDPPPVPEAVAHDATLQYYEPWFKPQSAVYAVHIDLGISNDAAGFCLAHLGPPVEGFFYPCHKQSVTTVLNTCPKCEKAYAIPTVVPTVVVDVIQSFVPPPGGEIQISDLRKKIFHLQAMGFNIQMVTGDRFQSTDTMQILKARNLRCEIVSVDRTLEPYDTLRNLIYEHRILCYNDATLRKELYRLVLINGRKVDHLQGGSKDAADAVCGAAYALVTKLWTRRPMGVQHREFLIGEQMSSGLTAVI